FDWGNATGTLRWNHLINNKMFSNTSLIYSNYNYKLGIDFAGLKADVVSRIEDYNLKQDFQYFANRNNEFKFGFNSIYHQIVPGILDFGANTNVAEREDIRKTALENAIYASHQF